jgi:Uncharacterized conserved protein
MTSTKSEIGIASGTELGYTGWKIGLLEFEGLFPRASDVEATGKAEGVEATAIGAVGGTELELEAEKVEAKLKTEIGGLSRKDLNALPPFSWYTEHFAAWGRAYPVLLQAQAIASKGRRLHMPDRLVLAMFIAEMEGRLLTAGHDLSTLSLPLSIERATGDEAMPCLGGSSKAIPAGDLLMRDRAGIVASLLLGPDERTSIRADTRRLLFVIYAPAPVGAELVQAQLERLAQLTSLACPDCERGESRVLEIGQPVPA